MHLFRIEYYLKRTKLLLVAQENIKKTNHSQLILSTVEARMCLRFDSNLALPNIPAPKIHLPKLPKRLCAKCKWSIAV